ncbi:MAG: 4-(cytidine 5'-diphospho)-2-C-methyl-D-erythritol kinase [Oscillospiraceae bacterium]
MKKVEEKAYAKINLVLNIGDLRPDGYHDIQTIMQSLELHDDVTVEQTGGTGITVTASVDTIPTDESNLAAKAVKAFAAKTGVLAEGLSIHIEKRIPVAAGLGGGSSDAAATLRALNVLYETNLSVDELAEIGIEVGSDVPFCVHGGCAYVEGKGDMVVPTTPMPQCIIVIGKPDLAISTEKMYQRFDQAELPQRADHTPEIMLGLRWENLKAVAESVGNAFEQVLMKNERNTVDMMKEVMNQFGTLGTAMTGSGPAVFGIFDNELYARVASETLRQRLKGNPEIVETEPMLSK